MISIIVLIFFIFVSPAWAEEIIEMEEEKMGTHGRVSIEKELTEDISLEIDSDLVHKGGLGIKWEDHHSHLSLLFGGEITENLFSPFFFGEMEKKFSIGGHEAPIDEVEFFLEGEITPFKKNFLHERGGILFHGTLLPGLSMGLEEDFQQGTLGWGPIIKLKIFDMSLIGGDSISNKGHHLWWHTKIKF